MELIRRIDSQPGSKDRETDGWQERLDDSKDKRGR